MREPKLISERMMIANTRRIRNTTRKVETRMIIGTRETGKTRMIMFTKGAYTSKPGFHLTLWARRARRASGA